MKHLLLLVAALAAPALAMAADEDRGRYWLAGDHHVHSEFSLRFRPDPSDPAALPTPQADGDGRYAMTINAERARTYGLDWIVTADHGGPGRSSLAFDRAYPALEAARGAVPELIQFYGMEFDTPGGDHSTLILPIEGSERAALRDYERRFSTRDAWPTDPARNAEARGLAALRYFAAQPSPPILIANHPSRSAAAGQRYGLYTADELRAWNAAAPGVAIGMEGAPGHQASGLRRDGSPNPQGRRGGYLGQPTMGGFDPMTARLGGLWDAMLGEGRHWWITASSDSHRNWRDGGNDFWPGEYTKTYVRARRNPTDILGGLRAGRIFVVTGDLIRGLCFSVRVAGTRRPAAMGDTLIVPAGRALAVTVRMTVADWPNAHGDRPQLNHVDLIAGGALADGAPGDDNPTTRVLHRFMPGEWQRRGNTLSLHWLIEDARGIRYLRLRGTNTDEAEPAPDPAGEDPWGDLWFYSNPVFLRPAGQRER
jgi:hypothetical protein